MALGMLTAAGLCAPAAAQDGGAQPVVVSIEGSAFVPEKIKIRAGTEVVWKNRDAAPHTVSADDGSFDSGSMDQGAEYRRKFTTPGTVSYSCGMHAWMAGKVEITE